MHRSLVVLIRAALLPLVIHGVRQAHAAARARPQLRALSERYRGRKDPESLRSFARQRREIAAEHRMSRLGCLPVLMQVPIWLALYHLVADVAVGAPVGAVDSGLAASLSAATLLGVPLAERGYLGAGWAHLAVVAGLAATAALFSFVTQKYLIASNTVLLDVPDAVARAQQLMPAISAIGLIVAGGLVPVALLVYWCATRPGRWASRRSVAMVPVRRDRHRPARAAARDLGRGLELVVGQPADDGAGVVLRVPALDGVLVLLVQQQPLLPITGGW